LWRSIGFFPCWIIICAHIIGFASLFYLKLINWSNLNPEGPLWSLTSPCFRKIWEEMVRNYGKRPWVVSCHFIRLVPKENKKKGELIDMIEIHRDMRSDLLHSQCVIMFQKDPYLNFIKLLWPQLKNIWVTRHFFLSK